MNLIPIDEVNAFRTGIDLLRDNLDPEQVVDEVLEILIYSYIRGVEYVRRVLKYDYKPSTEEMYDVIYKKIKDEDFEERILAYAILGDVDGIMLVVETDVHRVYNTAIVNGAKEAETGEKGEGGTKSRKVWRTMQDDKVRDTHFYLEGMEVGANEEFYTYDGDHAAQPGGFERAENNCNCRCWIELITDDDNITSE